MSTLFDRTIAASYTELLKTASTSGVTSTLTVVEDGDATASALQISTSTVKSSGNLEVVGPATLASSLSVTGASTLTGSVTMGGDLTVTGNAVIQGTLTANGGTLTLGDADTDNVVFNAEVNSHILPNTDNTYDLGSASKSWRNLHLDGTATVNNLSITGSQTVSATTQSTDKDTGALVVEGGVGIEKNTNIGGNLAVTGTALLSSTLGVSDTISATKASGTGLAVTANATVGGDLTVSGNLNINGTIGTGVWQGTIVSPTYGGTGVNNASRTITLGGNLTTSGAFNTTLTSTAATNVTLPTAGTLATLANAETLTNKTINLANNTLQATSAQIATAVTDETGTGSLVFSDSPALTGTPTASTAAADTNSTQIATTAHVFAERSNTATLTNKTLNLSNNTLVATSAQMASSVTDETGSGSLVFGTSPTLVTPNISSIVNTGTLTLPTSTDTLVGRNTTDTLTNKTLTSPIMTSPTLGAASATSLTLTNPLSVANGGTGRSTLGAINTFLGVNAAGTAFENKTLNAGTGIQISDVSGTVTITNTGSGGGGGGGGSASGAVAIYRYNATAGQTVFSGPDASSPSSTLYYTANYIHVFVNGVKLDDSDFTATNGTSVTLSTACVLNDDVDIVAFGAVPQLANPSGAPNYVVGTDSAGTALQYKQLVAGTGVSITHGTGSVTISASGASPISAPLAAFRYIASSGQTVFSGVDNNGNTLSFTPGFLYVFVNGVLLAPTLDYTTTGSNTVTLVSGTSNTDFVDILAFGQVTTIGLSDSSVTTAKIADSNITTAKIADSNVTTAKIADSNVTTAKIADGSVTAVKLAAGAAVPSQTGNSGRYLTTDGSSASWATAPVGFRNRIINGDMRIDQRNAGASQSITAASPSYSVDRFIVRPVGGTVTGQRISGSGSDQFRYQITGGASVTQLQFEQRIEAANCYDLAGKTATLSLNTANSILTTVNWILYYANSTDNFSANTLISSGNWTVNSTISNYSASISIPAAATTGLYLILFVGAQTSGTWTIGNVQLEAGSTATDFERRPYGTELALCQRYYEKSFPINYAPAVNFTQTGFVRLQASQSGINGTAATIQFAVIKRSTPSMTTYANAISGSGRYHISGNNDYTDGGMTPGESSFYMAMPSTGNQNEKMFHWTADAEL